MSQSLSSNGGTTTSRTHEVVSSPLVVPRATKSASIVTRAVPAEFVPLVRQDDSATVGEVGRGNADHLLLSPSGNAFLLETKALAGRITVERGQLTCRFSDDPIDVRRYPVTEPISKLKTTVRDEWARRTGREAPDIQPVVVVWGDLRPTLARDGELVILAGERLEAFLRERETGSAAAGG